MSDLIMGPGRATPEDLVAGFDEDLKTQWIPDAIGGADVMRVIRRGQSEALEFDATWRVEELEVATRKGIRKVRDVDTVTRAHLHCTVEDSIRDAERSLSKQVFGYRDATTDYSLDWTRFLSALNELAGRNQFVVEADIKSCFESISLNAIRAGRWAPPSLLTLLSRVHATTGQVLIPGHRWSRRVANIVLGHIDKTIRAPFCRWQDDYKIGCRSRQEADQVLGELASAAASLDLRLNTTKTRIVPAEERRASFRLEEPDPSVDHLLNIYSNGLEERNLSGLKYSLVRLVGNAQPAVLHTLEDAVRELPSLAPRAAVYLDSVIDNPQASSLVLNLARSHDTWIIGRFIPVVVRNPKLSERVEATLIDTLLSHQVEGISSLAARVALRRDVAVNHASERVRQWVTSVGPWADLPTIATRL